MKKILMLIVAMAVVFSLSLSFTYAFLTDSEGPITNVFTSSSGVDILLREPTWDGYTFEDPDDDPNTEAIDGWDHGESFKDGYDGPTLGYTLAHAYLPGDVIPKDPTIMKTEDSIDTYVAMELIYSVDDVIMTREDFEAYLANPIDYDLVNWTDNSDTTDPLDENMGDFFVYNDVLDDIDDTTTPLFTEIEIGFNNLVDSLMIPDDNGYYPNLEIYIHAYAIQAANVDDPTAELISFAEYGAEAE